MHKRIILISILLGLTACGYHLRGYSVSSSSSAATLSSVSIQTTAGISAATQVRSQLQLANIDTNASEPEVILKLQGENFNRAVLSVSATTGKVEEYQLTLRVTASASKSDGKSLFVNEVFSITRGYTYDEDAVLGKSNEEEALRENMTRQVASNIVRRLNTAASK